MDARHGVSATIPPDDGHNSHTVTTQADINLPAQAHPPAPTNTRYFHRAPLIFPQNHQQRLRTPSPRFTSSYLGPLNQHRSRFLSAWDLTPRPNAQPSARHTTTTPPTPAPAAEQHDQAALSPRSPLRPIVVVPTASFDEGAHASQAATPNATRRPPATVAAPGHSLPPKSAEMDARSPKINHSSRSATTGTASAPKSVAKHHDDHARASRPSTHKATRNTITSLQTPPSAPKRHDESSRSSRPTAHAATTSTPTVPPQPRAEGSSFSSSCVFRPN